MRSFECRADRQMEGFIKDHTYFSGTSQPGMGDFMLAYPMSTLIPETGAEKGTAGRKGPYKLGPGLERWMARIRERYVWTHLSLGPFALSVPDKQHPHTDPQRCPKPDLGSSCSGLGAR